LRRCPSLIASPRARFTSALQLGSTWRGRYAGLSTTMPKRCSAAWRSRSEEQGR
jgi:hypothetical protein